MSDFDGVLQSSGYVFLFLLVGLESLGVPLPGETALVTAAASAGAGYLSIYSVIVTAAVAAIAGDNGGYWIGKKGGVTLIRRYGRVFRLNESHLVYANAFFKKHGAKTVFLGRFVALLRTWAAVLAGMGNMHYPTFMLHNALGGIVWAVVFGILGYAFGSNLPLLHHYLGRATLFVAAGVMAAGLYIGWRWMRRNVTR